MSEHQTRNPVEDAWAATVALKEAINESTALLRDGLNDRNLSKVADATGLHENTIRNIAKGRGSVPTLATIDRLYKYLFA
jgi:transcriptional regulator with XRE-family HTH domain